VYVVGVIGEDRAVAQNPNSDVDRAMSALGATSIPYRSFADVPSAPTISAETADNTADFPLLVSALPAAAPFRIPHARMPARDNSDNSPMGNSVPMKAAAPVTEAQVPARPMMQPDAPQPAEQARRLETPTPSPSVNPPFRHTPSSPESQPDMGHAASDGIDSHRTTPLAAVFRTLHAARPAPAPRTGTQTKLQNMFSLL
jgi:hypothetical protein